MNAEQPRDAMIAAIEEYHAKLAEIEMLRLANADQAVALAFRDGKISEQRDYIAGLRADHVQMLGIIESLRAQLKHFQAAMRELSPRIEAFNGSQGERARQSHAIEGAPPMELAPRSAPRGNGTARIGSLAARIEAAEAVA
jgi:hypothetical protein